MNPSCASEMIVNAQLIKSRLRNPSNAVPDIGIDLKRLRKGFQFVTTKILRSEAPPPEPPKIIPIDHDDTASSVPIEFVRKPFSRSVRGIQRAVADRYGHSIADIRGPGRHMPLVLHRQIAMHLVRKILKCSYPKLGLQFGGRDHTTTLWSCRKIQRLITADPAFAAEVDALEQTIMGAAQ